ncbi:unnamed protein product [Rotaria socialis]|uniref:Uncharacterized protein n=2 Tax=Rotaria socialis TaxID=392032 RepID=A0A818WB53_9BILA|nr:unnamed protein product [Rotaria socialis]CAF4611652.1 unnamed protein product [Rotaria socialis]
MKAALAIVFFACIAGSMANPLAGAVQQLLGQGQGVLQAIVGQLQQSLMGLVQQALGNVQTLIGTIGARFDFTALLGNFQEIVNLATTALNGNLSGLLQGLLGLGRADFNFGQIIQQFIDSVKPAVIGLGQHALNQGLSAVLGALGSLAPTSRAIGDIFGSLSEQFSTLVGNAQTALQGALGQLAAIGSGILDASKPHFQQLQEQLVGHGLNALGSLSETINNLHGSIVGRR